MSRATRTRYCPIPSRRPAGAAPRLMIIEHLSRAAEADCIARRALARLSPAGGHPQQHDPRIATLMHTLRSGRCGKAAGLRLRRTMMLAAGLGVPAPESVEERIGVTKPPYKRPATSRGSADTRMAPDRSPPFFQHSRRWPPSPRLRRIHWAAQDEPRNGRRLAARPRPPCATSTCCIGLTEISAASSAIRAPLRRRGRSRLLPAQTQASSVLAFRRWCPPVQQLVNDVASMLVLAAQEQLRCHVRRRGRRDRGPENIYFAFGDAQERLNKLIQGRATLKVSVDRSWIT